ncbi:hypothetical protein [Nonomuraea sp. NPDC050691]
MAPLERLARDIGKLQTTVRLDRRVMLCVLMAVLAVAGVPAA